MVTAEPVLDAAALLGEGPVWDVAAGRLLWVDILRRELHAYDPGTGRDTAVRHDEPVTAVAPAAGGGLIAAVGGGVALLDGAAGPGRRLAELPTGDRANDAKCDPAGRFLVGTLTEAQRPGACGLYRLEAPGRVVPVLEDVTLANGLGWSPDGGRLYFADTPTQRVDVLDYDPDTGIAAGRRSFADLTEAGRPDGLTVDAEGGVWVALVRSGQVRRYDPGGRLDAVVEVPAGRVTSCAFGGPRLDELYVTTGRFGMSAAEVADVPLSGALFRIRPGVAGRPADAWRPVHRAADREEIDF